MMLLSYGEPHFKKQKELLRFCRHLPAQVCYVYFTFYLVNPCGCGKPTLLEHYRIRRQNNNTILTNSNHSKTNQLNTLHNY